MSPMRYITALILAMGLMTLPAYAEDDDKPTSALDVTGNVKSFFNGLGKGVKIAPNTDRIVLARGMLAGLPNPPPGFNYNAVCYEGDELPTAMQHLSDGRDGVVGGTFKFSAAQVVKCKYLIANRLFTIMPPGTTQRGDTYMGNPQGTARLPLYAPNRTIAVQPMPGNGDAFDKIKEDAHEQMARINAESDARMAAIKARSAERSAMLRQQRQQQAASRSAGGATKDACASARDILNNPAGYPPQAIKGMHDFLETCPK